jgi:hypothetical protein
MCLFPISFANNRPVYIKYTNPSYTHNKQFYFTFNDAIISVCCNTFIKLKKCYFCALLLYRVIQKSPCSCKNTYVSHN